MQYNAQEIMVALENKELVLYGCKKDHEFKHSQIQAASIDLSLDNRFIRFLPNVDCIDIKENTNASYLEGKTKEVFIDEDKPLVLEPHETVFGQVYEGISLGKCMSGRIEGRSKVARLGISVHCTGSYINPGYTGVMPLQITNHNNFQVKIYPYISICQLILFHLNNPPIIEYGANNHFQGEKVAMLSDLSLSSKNPVDEIYEEKVKKIQKTYLEDHKREEGLKSQLCNKDKYNYQKIVKEKLKAFIMINQTSLFSLKDTLSEDLSKMEVESKAKNEFIYELKKCEILLLTANLVEDIMLTHFLYQQNNEKLLKYAIKGYRIQIGTFGGKQVAHISQKNMGSSSDKGSEEAVKYALSLFSPKMIVSIGVAYGAICPDQNIGDVLVSDKIIDVDKANKRNNGKYTFPIDSIYKSNCQISASWGHSLSAKNHMKDFNWFWGTLLSKGTVLSDAKEKNSLLEAAKGINEKYIIGGEMEGAGIARACRNEAITPNWLVIKGICDWGEQKNNLGEIAQELNISESNDSIKDSIQAFASNNAFRSLQKLLEESPSAIDGIT